MLSRLPHVAVLDSASRAYNGADNNLPEDRRHLAPPLAHKDKRYLISP